MNYNPLYIPPHGSQIEKAIINVINIISGTVYKITKSNGDKLDKYIQNTNDIEIQVNEDNETILDLAYSNEQLQDQVSEDNEMILDIDYRLSQIEDKEA